MPLFPFNSYNGQTGAITVFGDPGGRPTLTTGTPVLSANVTGATSVFYTPYTHSSILLFDGANWVPTQFAEVSQLLSDTTKSPAAAVANSNYDYFGWNDAGTFRATRGPPWTSNTARGSGAGTTQIQQQNGIWVNAVAITNGPAAQRGRYLFSARTNATATVDWNPNPAPAAGGNNNTLGLWSLYNRVLVTAVSRDSTASWVYATSTWRAANGNANNAINFIDGMGWSAIDAQYTVVVSGATSGAGLVGVNLDSTSATPGAQGLAGFSAISGDAEARQGFAPQLGFHTINAVESVFNNTSNTFYGSGFGTGAGQTQALVVALMM